VRRPHNNWLLLVGPLLATVFFLIDVNVELGVATGMLYVFLVLITLPRRAQKHTFAAATTGVVLVFVGWYLSPEGGDWFKVMANRVLSIGAILGTALAIALKHEADRALEREQAKRSAVEQELVEQAATLRLGEMATVVAAEVKNPMTGILGALQVLGRRLPEAADEQRVLRLIADRVRALVDWTDELLGYARPAPPALGPVSAMDLATRAVARLRTAEEYASLGMEVDASRDVVLSADGELLERALLHLLRNAAEATKGQGNVRIQVIAERAGWAEVVVLDDGPGLPETLRGEGRRPFIDDDGSGHGLGLPTVERTVVAHGGTLTLECPDSGGTRVSMLLPLYVGEPAAEPSDWTSAPDARTEATVQQREAP